MKILLPTVASAVVLVVCLVIYSSVSPKAQKPLDRPLIPANDDLSLISDGHPIGSKRIVFFFGSCFADVPASTNRFPVIAALNRVAGRIDLNPLVEVSMSEDGARVSGQFFDENGKVVAILKDNVPVFGPSVFNPERPDDSTLIVRDQSNVEVLNIRFARTNAFTFSGMLRSPNGAEVVVRKSEVEFTKGNQKPLLRRIKVIDAVAICVDMEKNGIGTGKTSRL